jgi:hypothetical protein
MIQEQQMVLPCQQDQQEQYACHFATSTSGPWEVGSAATDFSGSGAAHVAAAPPGVVTSAQHLPMQWLVL